MKRIHSIFKVVTIAFVLVAITSCSGSDPDGRDPKEAVSAFINNNDAVVGFGNVSLKGVLTKADYKNVPMIGKLMGTEIATLERLIDIESPVYYALEGPFDKDGSPAVSYVFIRVKNADSLVAELTSRGFDVNEKEDIRITQDGDFALGIKKNLAIALTKKGDFDAEKLIKEAFKKTDGDLSGGQVDAILNETGDVVLGMSIASLYGTSETDLSDLSKDKQNEIKDLVADSYVQTIIKFEEGAAIIETKNFFSAELKKHMFFVADKNAPVLAKLGAGNPRLGLAVNIDVKKMQGFMDEYSPETMKDLIGAMGGPAQMAFMMAGKDGLAGLFNGKIGVVALGNPTPEGGWEPDFNFFVGLGPKGHDLGSSVKEMLSYSMQNVYLDNDGISGFTNAKYAPSGSNRINLPNGCEKFGQSGISAFMNFEGFNFDDLDLEGGQNVLRVVKYATFDYNDNGGRLYIKAKEGKEMFLNKLWMLFWRNSHLR